MTSVLYGSGLNYQSGNPLRSEITQLRREVVDLRKLLDDSMNEAKVYRKYIAKLLQESDQETFNEMNNEIFRLESSKLQTTSSSGQSAVVNNNIKNFNNLSNLSKR